MTAKALHYHGRVYYVQDKNELCLTFDNCVPVAQCAGDFLWSTTSEAERLEIHQQLTRQEKVFRRDGKLREKASQLQGAATSFDAQLTCIMGEFGEDYSKAVNNMNELRMRLRAEGKSDSEIQNALRQDYEKNYKGDLQLGTWLPPKSQVYFNLL